MEHFEKHIQENDVKKTILDDYPVPEIMGSPKVIDDYLKEMLLEAKKIQGTGARPKPGENPTKGFQISWNHYPNYGLGWMSSSALENLAE